ncbi:MAG TPA: hypothetical protein VIF64_03630 [Pyrinomonadaceae bacterium]|jgi:hypothetical protein
MCKKKRKWARLGICSLFLGALVLGGLLLGPQPASALDPVSVCMQTNYTNHGLTQSLGCTANDVRVARATNIDITSGGSCTGTGANRRCTCNEGGNVTFSADYEVLLTAQARYDIGIYFSTDGDSNGDGALTGQCKLTTLDGNSSNPINLDAIPGKSFQAGDVCGDIDDAHNPQLLHLTLTVKCEPDPITGKLKLPNCTSWRQSGANEVCNETEDAFPGSPSKCNCEPGFTVDIFTETATIDVAKSADPSTFPETGGDVTYTVTVTNNAAQASVTLDSLTDDKFGNITTAHAAGGGFLQVVSTTCALVTIPAGNVAGNPYICTFVGRHTSGDTGQQVKDTVTACGTDSFGHTNLCDTGDATVTVADVETAPSLTKTAKSATFTADVSYEVVVTNNSTIDTMTVNTLSDNKFGDISATHAAGNGFEQVVSTDCGPLPINIAPDHHLSCTFVGRINTSPHVNNVTGGLTDDDAKTFSVSDPDGGATVTVTITFGP